MKINDSVIWFRQSLRTNVKPVFEAKRVLLRGMKIVVKDEWNQGQRVTHLSLKPFAAIRPELCLHCPRFRILICLFACPTASTQ